MRSISKGMVVTVLLVSFFSGWGISSLWERYNAGKTDQKPVTVSRTDYETINKDSQIVYEQKFIRCGHVVISEFPEKDKLFGQTLPELQRVYNRSNGFQLSMQGTALVIRQEVDDWCPQDKNMYRLKEYQGRVAIYQGPDADNDALLRVTNLQIDLLPEEVQQKIRAGSYQFISDQELNDVLENFDEYL